MLWRCTATLQRFRIEVCYGPALQLSLDHGFPCYLSMGSSLHSQSIFQRKPSQRPLESKEHLSLRTLRRLHKRMSQAPPSACPAVRTQLIEIVISQYVCSYNKWCSLVPPDQEKSSFYGDMKKATTVPERFFLIRPLCSPIPIQGIQGYPGLFIEPLFASP